MATIENLSSQDPDKVISRLYLNTRADPAISSNMVEASIARDFQGNPITDPQTGDYHYLEFTPIYHYPEEEIKLKSTIWNELFGTNGYLLNQKSKKVKNDMNLIEIGFAMAEYAHQLQYRESGETYIQHPERATLDYIKKYKPPAWRIAAFLNHDAVEDTEQLKIEDENGNIDLVPHPYHVTLSDIENLLGKKAERFVKRLTKIRRVQKLDGKEKVETDKVNTIYSLLLALGGFETSKTVTPVDITWKIGGDILDNTRTLDGIRDVKDKLRVASGYFELYPILANIVGLYEEEEIIADQCFEILDEDSHKDGFVNKLKKGVNEYLDPLNTEEIVEYTKKILKDLTDTGFRKFIIDKPGIYKIAKNMNGSRDPQKEDFYITGTIVLDDSHPSDAVSESPEIGYYTRALNIVNSLILSKNYHLAPSTLLKLEEALKQIDSGNFDTDLLKEIPLIFNESTLKLTFKRKSDFDIETTSLTYLEAQDLTEKDILTGEYSLEDRCVLAQVRRQKIAEKFAALISDKYLTKEEKIRSILLTLPDSIFVTGVKLSKNGSEERIRRPIPKNSTVLDYAILRTPGTWQNIQYVKVNGKVVRDMGQILQEDDKIHIKFAPKNINNVQVDWLDKTNIEPDNTKKIIANKIEERIRQVRDENVKQTLIKEVRHRGIEKVRTHLLYFDHYGLVWGKDAFPEASGMNPRDFVYHLGLEKVDSQTFGDVIEELKKCWENLTVISVLIKGAVRPGPSGEISGIFSQFGLNIVAEIYKSIYGDTGRKVYRISKNDENFSRLNEVLNKLKDSGYIPVTFDNNQQYQQWLSEYRELED